MIITVKLPITHTHTQSVTYEVVLTHDTQSITHTHAHTQCHTCTRTHTHAHTPCLSPNSKPLFPAPFLQTLP